jgi:hypothetical protein
LLVNLGVIYFASLVKDTAELAKNRLIRLCRTNTLAYSSRKRVGMETSFIGSSTKTDLQIKFLQGSSINVNGVRRRRLGHI